MRAEYRELIKHSGVYGIGQVLTRMASVLMLPVYTRFLAPGDYGVVAILDLTVGVLAIIIGGGMVSAVSRYHFDTDDPHEQNRIWWTGVAVVAAMASAVLLLAFPARDAIAALMLGASTTNGSYFYVLTLFTLWFAVVGQLPDQYIRVRKWSFLSVGLALAGLTINIALNLYFLAVMRMGIAGVLLGNLLTNGIVFAARFAVMVSACGAPAFRRALATELWRFGAPIAGTGLLALVMHEADRYILRLSRDLGEVGLYSLAYNIGQGFNAIFLIPFAAIWGVMVYEIARQPDAARTYARVFEYFLYALMLFLFGVSLVIRPVFALLLPPEYQPAARLIPIVSLAFLFFSTHEHFKVPALLRKQTVSMLWPFTVGAIANVGLNLLVLRRFGATGAAWTSVATYALFSAIALLRYRRIERYHYPLVRCSVILVAMIASYVACEYVYDTSASAGLALGLAAVVWLGWAFALLRPLLSVRWWGTAVPASAG